MPWFDIFWTDEIEEHIDQHALTLDEIQYVLENFPVDEDASDSSGRPICFGTTQTGRTIAVVFEWLDDITLLPVTAYDVED